MKISTNPVRGTYDYAPKQAELREKVRQIIMNSYAKNQNQPIKAWMVPKMQEQLPNRNPKEIAIIVDEIIGTIESGKIPALSQVKKVPIKERGKERIITPIKIDDRITQKVVCDNSLVDSIQRDLIYDNGASTKGKGTNFARNRIYEMMMVL